MKNFLHKHYFFRSLFRTGLLSFLFLDTIFSLKASNEVSKATISPKAYFLNISSLDFSQIPPPSAKNGSNGHNEELQILKDAMAARTKKQVTRATSAVRDSVFDYASVLGPNFNAQHLPITATLFTKVKSDAKLAIHAAKEEFHQRRPMTWKKMKAGEQRDGGYAYPSGHSTRGFLWAMLLADIFPQHRKEIILEARKKAWNRVILGRHYPNDVYGGQRYGKYLAKQFLKSSNFQKDLVAVKQEVKGLNSLINIRPTNQIFNLKTGMDVNDIL